jgi:hypothetical protein
MKRYKIIDTKWMERVQRMDDNRMPKIALNYEP